MKIKVRGVDTELHFEINIEKCIDNIKLIFHAIFHESFDTDEEYIFEYLKFITYEMYKIDLTNRGLLMNWYLENFNNKRSAYYLPVNGVRGIRLIFMDTPNISRDCFETEKIEGE